MLIFGVDHSCFDICPQFRLATSLYYLALSLIWPELISLQVYFWINPQGGQSRNTLELQSVSHISNWFQTDLLVYRSAIYPQGRRFKYGLGGRLPSIVRVRVVAMWLCQYCRCKSMGSTTNGDHSCFDICHPLCDNLGLSLYRVASTC